MLVGSIQNFLRKRGFPAHVGLKTLIPLAKMPRNALVSSLYNFVKPRELPLFLTRAQDRGSRKLLCVISFNLPWAIEQMVRSCNRFLPDWQLMVFDNSSDKTARSEISAICARHDTLYLALPKNPEWSPNRSHAVALNWVYKNVVSVVHPRRFGFLDHDCFPMALPPIDARLEEHLVHGDFRPSKTTEGVWNLWAGYVFFDGTVIDRFRLDFNHDQLRRLDTGGRNWIRLYRHIDSKNVSFAFSEGREVTSPNGQCKYVMQFIDGSFVHIGGASYHKYDNSEQSYLSTIRCLVDSPLL